MRLDRHVSAFFREIRSNGAGWHGRKKKDPNGNNKRS
jgi:hypothetical protein